LPSGGVGRKLTYPAASRGQTRPGGRVMTASRTGRGFRIAILLTVGAAVLAGAGWLLYRSLHPRT
jgi:hypothetical protein